MARSSKKDFEEWICNHNIPDSVEEYLRETSYDTIDMLKYLDCKTIDKSDLSIQDKHILKSALELDSEENEFEEWCDEHRLSDSLKTYLLNKGFDSVQKIQDISLLHIQNFKDLPIKDKEFLIDLMDLEIDSDDSSNETEVYRVESLKWKEFGLARYFKKWKKSFYPVEIFCPDGFWAWNSSTKSLLYGTQNVSQVWNRFEDNKPGWIMSPPVLLPNVVGSWKISFSLRVIPKVSDDAPILQLLLINDGYNKRLEKFHKLPVEVSMTFKFINLSNGLLTGVPLNRNIVFQELHDSHNIRIPGNILALKTPPVILVEVLNK